MNEENDSLWIIVNKRNIPVINEDFLTSMWIVNNGEVKLARNSWEGLDSVAKIKLARDYREMLGMTHVTDVTVLRRSGQLRTLNFFLFISVYLFCLFFYLRYTRTWEVCGNLSKINCGVEIYFYEFNFYIISNNME